MFQIKRLKEWQQDWSIQCIPLRKGNVKKIQMPLWAIALCFFSIGIFVASTLFISSFFWFKTVGLETELVHMESYHVQNKELTKEIESMEHEFAEMEYQLEYINQKILNLDSWLKQLEGLHHEVDTLYSVLPPVLQKDVPVQAGDKQGETVRIASLDQGFLPTVEELALEKINDLDDMRLSLEQLYTRASHQEAQYFILKEALQTKIKEARLIPSILPAQGRITSTYGLRKDPFTRKEKQHHGIDIANQYLTPVYATANGTVVLAERKSGYGRTIYLEHGNSYQTLYAHLAKLNVHVGDQVDQGTIIGYMGSTGRSTGVHLHYEIHHHGQPIDPLPYLNILP